MMLRFIIRDFLFYIPAYTNLNITSPEIGDG
jgi:hypothetical protein